MKRYRLLLAILMMLVIAGCRKDNPDENTPGAGFLRASGTNIVDGNGQDVLLKGVAFGNEVWSNREVPLTHHDETDFARVKAMNMNVIRFYLNYHTFESDAAPYTYKQSGWEWVDRNIAWARKYGIRLILNMHAPQGGYQSQGNGDALWNEAENQNRLVALWKAIADRYADEPQIAGFGILNEPVPALSLQQWKQLAQRITDSIRAVDRNHILFIEKAIYIKGNYAEDENLNFPLTVDDNQVAEFHFYEPHSYTHQLFDWAGLGDGGAYPDTDIISYTNHTWYSATFSNPSFPAGNTPWTWYEGVKFSISDPKMNIGIPALVGAKAGGRVWFDDLVIREFNEAGFYTRDVISSSLDEAGGWYYWSSDGSGEGGLAFEGHSNGQSLFISNTGSDCNLSNYSAAFVPKQGYSYQVCGWMKGEQLAAASSCKMRIDFLTTPDPVLPRDKTLLAARLGKYRDWAESKQVPLFLGEFGAGMYCFINNKGGLTWVGDVIDLSFQYNMSFCYHAYHEDSFGLYYGYGTLPDPNHKNQPLIDLLTKKLSK